MASKVLIASKRTLGYQTGTASAMCAGTHALNSCTKYHRVYKVRFGVPTSGTAEPYRLASRAVDVDGSDGSKEVEVERTRMCYKYNSTYSKRCKMYAR